MKKKMVAFFLIGMMLLSACVGNTQTKNPNLQKGDETNSFTTYDDTIDMFQKGTIGAFQEHINAMLGGSLMCS